MDAPLFPIQPSQAEIMSKFSPVETSVDHEDHADADANIDAEADADVDGDVVTQVYVQFETALDQPRRISVLEHASVLGVVEGGSSLSVSNCFFSTV